MKNLISLSVVVSALFASAATIRFSTTDSGADLSVSSNWEDNVLPGPDDIAVVPVLSGKTLQLNNALNVKGIVFENAGPFALSGSGELSIGADGLSCANLSDETAALFSVPMRTTCGQTWDFKGKYSVIFQSSISSVESETLVITGTKDVTHSGVVGYGGTIRYNGAGSLSYEADATERWAEKIYSSGLYVKILNKTDYSFSDLIPGGLVQDSFTQQMLMHNDYGGNTMVFGPLAVYTNRCNFTYFGRNTIRQTGGSFSMDGILSVWGGIYQLEGGEMSFTSHGPLIGVSTGRSVFRQTGGTFNGSSYIAIGAGADSATAYSEARVEGGTMTFPSANGRILISPNFHSSGLADPNPGIFTQTGGVVTVPGIQFGSSSEVWGNSWLYYQTNGYALVDISGGLLKLGANTFSFGKNWNRSEASPNEPVPEAGSRYDIRFSGGTVQGSAGTDWRNSLQIAIPPSAEGVALDWGERDISFEAPIWGEGNLKKLGSGTWKMSDASRFTGKLDVLEGAVVFVGEPLDRYTEDCVILTGDTAAENLEDGSDVTGWTDESGTLTATLLSEQLTEATNACLYPRVVTNAFNGHAGVRFRRETETSRVTALAIPSEVNPLACGSNCTVAVVFRNIGTTLFPNTGDHMWTYQTGVLGFSMGINTMGISIAANGQMSGARNYYDKGNVRVSSESSVADGETHVFVYTADGNTLTATCDGHVTQRTTTYELDRFCQFACWSGYDSIRYPVAAPFCIGLHSQRVWLPVGGETQPSPNFAFDGEIAEIRIYKNKVLNEAEINGLTAALRAKYAGVNDREVFLHADEVEATMPVAEDAPALPAGAVVFSAETLEGDDGKAVASWECIDGGVAAATETSGDFTAPVLVKDAISGKAAVRFDGTSALALGSEDSPLSGSTDFAFAVVFRTTAEGPATTDVRGGAGLLSASVGDAESQNDITLSYRVDGALSATYGGASPAVIRGLKPCRLGDGAVHLAVVSFDSASGILTRCIDGSASFAQVGTVSPRDSLPLLIGARAPGKDGFIGDIAAVSIWDRSLSGDELDTVVEHYARVYSFHPLAKEKFASDERMIAGLGATNINVAAGATFCMPYSRTAPFTLSARQTLSGEGTFKGSYRWGNGACLDVTSFLADVEDVQIASGAVLSVPGLPEAPLAIEGLSSVSGTVFVDISIPSTYGPFGWTNVIEIPASVIADGTVFLPVDVDTVFQVKYEDGFLKIRKSGSTLILIR